MMKEESNSNSDDNGMDEFDSDQLEFMPILKPQLPLLKSNPFLASTSTFTSISSNSLSQQNSSSKFTTSGSGTAEELDLPEIKKSPIGNLAYSSDEEEPPELKPDGLVESKMPLVQKSIKRKKISEPQVVSQKEEEMDNVEYKKCEHCPYFSKKPFNLRRHQLRHGPSLNVPDDQSKKFIYRSIVSKTSRSTTHEKLHLENQDSSPAIPCKSSNPEEDREIKMESEIKTPSGDCDEELKVGELDKSKMVSARKFIKAKKRVSKLQRLRQKESRDVYLFKCGECPYNTPQKKFMEKHKVGHKRTVEEFPNYKKCNYCSYFSDAVGIAQHHLLHLRNQSIRLSIPCTSNSEFSENDLQLDSELDPEMNKKSIEELPNSSDESETLKCKAEELVESKLTSNIGKIKLSDSQLQSIENEERNADGYRIYSCNQCPYVARRPREIRKHKLGHNRKVEDDPQFIKCKYCSYVSRNGSHLKVHLENPEPNQSIPSTLSSVETKLAQCNPNSRIILPKLSVVLSQVDPEEIRKLTNPKTNPKLSHTNLKMRIPDRDYPLKFWCMRCPYKCFTQEDYDTHKNRHLYPGSTGICVCQLCAYNSSNEAEHGAHVLGHYAQYDDLTDDDDEDGTLAKELQAYETDLARRKLEKEVRGIILL